MEPHNSAAKSSAHGQPIPAISNNFDGNNFPLHFASAATTNDNANSPFFMQTLQHLSGLSGAAKGLLPAAAAGGAHFPPTNGNFVGSEFTNWNSQPATWLDQAKMAAMLPVYLKTSATESDFEMQTNASIVERHLKSQAAAAAAVAGLQSIAQSPAMYNSNVSDKMRDDFLISGNGNLFQHSVLTKNNNVNVFKSQIDSNTFVQSQVSQLQHHCKTGGPVVAPQKYQNSSGVPTATNPPMGMAQSPISNGSPTVRHNLYGSPMGNRLINSHTSYPSSSSSHPPSNEGMIESPLSSYGTMPNSQHQPHYPQPQQHQYQEFEQNVNASPYQHGIYSLQGSHQPINITAPKESSLNMPPTVTPSAMTESNRNSTSRTIMQKSYTADDEHQIQLSNHKAQYHQQYAPPSSSAKSGPLQKTGMISITHAEQNVVENADDISTMLDLHEFEDFLNDKDAISAALRTDSGALFSDTASTSASQANTSTYSDGGGTSKSALLSVRKATMPYAPQITSARMRERIHERRAEELANADKELDRLVSLVARQNDVVPKPAKFSLLNLNLLGSLKQSNLIMPPSIENTGASDALLNPIQFTPPDSPMNAESTLYFDSATTSATDLLSNTLTQLKNSVKPRNDLPENSTMEKESEQKPEELSTSLVSNIKSILGSATGASRKSIESSTKANTQPLVFIPNAKTSAASISSYKVAGRKGDPIGIKYSRVPIYKQRLQNTSFASRILKLQSSPEKTSNKSIMFDRSKIDSKNASKSKSDAYNFTDDEEEESAMPKPAEHTDANSTNVGTLKRAAGLDGAASKSTDTPMAIRGRRRQSQINAERANHSHFVSVAPAGASDSRLHHAATPALSRPSWLLETLQRRRNERADFVRSIDCSRDVADDDADTAFTPDDKEGLQSCGAMRRRSTLTCVLKMEDSPPDAANDEKDNATPKSALPKLVIRIVKSKSVDESSSLLLNHSPKSKKKKKHKKRERDKEWHVDDDNDGDNKHHHRYHHRHKEERKHKRRRSHASEDGDVSNFFAERHCSVNANDTRINSRVSPPTDSLHESEVAIGTPSIMSQSPISKQERQFVDERLRWFGRANGTLPKGTFLVAKDDVFRADCPLWKIDNQNLLQKYPPIGDRLPDGGGHPLRYRNSSTYSGWCERIADDYLVLEVRFVKQSRAESIVEPLAPVYDLFPAVVSDLADDNLLALREHSNEPIADDPAKKRPEVADDADLRRHLRTFFAVMFRHVVTVTSLQHCVSDSSQATESLSAIEQREAAARYEILSRAKWTQRFIGALDAYSNLTYVDMEHAAATDSSSSLCQVCGSGDVASTSINLFGPYEESSIGLDDEQKLLQHDDTNCVATEFHVCGTCEALAFLYHRNAHLKFYLFRKCEEKLDEVAVIEDVSDPNNAIGRCTADQKWIENLINEQLNLWAECTPSSPATHTITDEADKST